MKTLFNYFLIRHGSACFGKLSMTPVVTLPVPPNAGSVSKGVKEKVNQSSLFLTSCKDT